MLLQARTVRSAVRPDCSAPSNRLFLPHALYACARWKHYFALSKFFTIPPPQTLIADGRDRIYRRTVEKSVYGLNMPACRCGRTHHTERPQWSKRRGIFPDGKGIFPGVYKNVTALKTKRIPAERSLYTVYFLQSFAPSCNFAVESLQRPSPASFLSAPGSQTCRRSQNDLNKYV